MLLLNTILHTKFEIQVTMRLLIKKTNNFSFFWKVEIRKLELISQNCNQYTCLGWYSGSSSDFVIPNFVVRSLQRK